MAVDPTTLNPDEQIAQHTAFVLTPGCLRCGSSGMSVRVDGWLRCDGCHRRVDLIEYAPSVFTRRPPRRVR